MTKHEHDYSPVVGHLTAPGELKTCHECGSKVPRVKPKTVLQCRICGVEKGSK